MISNIDIDYSSQFFSFTWNDFRSLYQAGAEVVLCNWLNSIPLFADSLYFITWNVNNENNILFQIPLQIISAINNCSFYEKIHIGFDLLRIFKQLEKEYSVAINQQLQNTVLDTINVPITSIGMSIQSKFLNSSAVASYQANENIYDIIGEIFGQGFINEDDFLQRPIHERHTSNHQKTLANESLHQQSEGRLMALESKIIILEQKLANIRTNLILPGQNDL